MDLFQLSSHSLLFALLRPCFRSLIACFKHSPRCRAAESSSSLCALPFMTLHIIHVLPLSQNGKLEPKWLRVRKSAVSDAETADASRFGLRNGGF